MTTTVRILGSRAREQLPGTSITLLAPGFRGAMTQLAAGAPSADAHRLPFAESAAAADVMLAAQLSVHLEARPPPEGAGLRSRSAIATNPRLIVPKRHGVAYAVLQTDERGVSNFIFPEGGDFEEAFFPLTIGVERATHRALRVLMWPAHIVHGAGPLVVVAGWEQVHRPYLLSQLGENREWRAPDWDTLSRGPLLLLLHGTLGTPQAAFDDWLADQSFARVLRRYEGRCLAFAHPTLSATPNENLAWLNANLPPRREPLDVVAHGRGGLVARALAAEGRLPLRRACLVGTPNSGTPLVFNENLPRYLDGHVAMLTHARHSAAQATLAGALCMTRFVALGLKAALPGLDAMAPGSLALRALGEFRNAPQPWFTIGAQFMRTGMFAADAATPTDLVVPSEGCHAADATLADSLRLGGSEVHHHNYFANTHVRARLDAWLG